MYNQERVEMLEKRIAALEVEVQRLLERKWRYWIDVFAGIVIGNLVLRLLIKLIHNLA